MRLSLRTRLMLTITVGLVLLVWIFPVYWTVASSFKTNQELMSGTPTLVPQQLTLDHYHRVLFGSGYFLYLQNSLTAAIGVMLLTLILSTGAAFALSRLRFPGRGLLGSLILLVYLFPGVLLIIPIFTMMASIGLYNSLLSLVFVHILYTLPFATWTLRVFFDAIPSELEDAAMIDGSTRMQVLRHIYLPLATPGLAVAAIFSFVVSWNEYMFASILVVDARVKTIPVGIADWVSGYSIDWGSLTAASILTILPAFFFFVLLGRLFVRGLTAGATKG